MQYLENKVTPDASHHVTLGVSPVTRKILLLPKSYKTAIRRDSFNFGCKMNFKSDWILRWSWTFLFSALYFQRSTGWNIALKHFYETFTVSASIWKLQNFISDKNLKTKTSDSAINISESWIQRISKILVRKFGLKILAYWSS